MEAISTIGNGFRYQYDAGAEIDNDLVVSSFFLRAFRNSR
jgi:hypothetical protein